jgi:transposase
MDELRMSCKERDRLKVMAALAEGRLKQVEAGGLLRLSVRQVRRLLRRYEREGDAGLVHRSRGRPSNRRIPEATRRRVMALVRRHYADFGPTLAAEKLAERVGIEVSREWLRQRMIEAHLRTVRRRRVARRMYFGHDPTHQLPARCLGAATAP